MPNIENHPKLVKNLSSIGDLELVNKIKEELIAECEIELKQPVQNNRLSVMSESDKLSETSSDSGNGLSELLANQDESYDDMNGLSSIEHHNGENNDSFLYNHELCAEIKEEEVDEEHQTVPAVNKEVEVNNKMSSKKVNKSSCSSTTPAVASTRSSKKSAKSVKVQISDKKVEENGEKAKTQLTVEPKNEEKSGNKSQKGK